MNTESCNINEIKELIPHRYPFLLIDKVVDIVKNETATGIKNVTVNEPYFPGHFPSSPVVPGVLQIESLAQTAAVLVAKSLDLADSSSLVLLTTIDNAIDTIANTRAKFGASENAIDHRLSYLLNVKSNSTLRLSKIEDADFALETARLTRAQIMSKAASSMLAQANSSGDVFLRLIN